MTILVTGASGFIGSAVVRRLLRAGHQVRTLVRPSSDRRNLTELPVEIVTGDLADRPSLERSLRGCRFLFHVAADYRLWVTNPEAMYRSNIEGTRNIMLAAVAAGVERIVYTSSVATLGLNPDGEPADETTPSSLDEMLGPYKRSKFLAEGEVRRLVEEQGLPAVIVNPSTPVGPGDVKPTPTGRMIVDAVSGRMPAYVETGLNLVHVDDVAQGHLLALERGTIGKRYILGGENLSLQEILIRLATISGHPPPRFRLPHNLVLPIAYVAEVWARIRGTQEPMLTINGVRLSKKKMFFSSARAVRELGFAPRPVDEALEEAVAWFHNNGYLSKPLSQAHVPD